MLIVLHLSKEKDVRLLIRQVRFSKKIACLPKAVPRGFHTNRNEEEEVKSIFIHIVWLDLEWNIRWSPQSDSNIIVDNKKGNHTIESEKEKQKQIGAVTSRVTYRIVVEDEREMLHPQHPYPSSELRPRVQIRYGALPALKNPLNRIYIVKSFMKRTFVSEKFSNYDVLGTDKYT